MVRYYTYILRNNNLLLVRIYNFFRKFLYFRNLEDIYIVRSLIIYIHIMDNAFNLIFNTKEVMLAIQTGTNFDAKPGLILSNGIGIELVCGNNIRIKPKDFRMVDIENITEDKQELNFDLSLKEFHQHLSEVESENFTVYLRFHSNGKVTFNIIWL